MKKLRTLALILAHAGLVLSVLFLVLCMIGNFVPDIAEIARLDFFVFDYFYLIIPLLCIASGILLQVITVRKKKKAKSAPSVKES